MASGRRDSWNDKKTDRLKQSSISFLKKYIITKPISRLKTNFISMILAAKIDFKI